MVLVIVLAFSKAGLTQTLPLDSISGTHRLLTFTLSAKDSVKSTIVRDSLRLRGHFRQEWSLRRDQDSTHYTIRLHPTVQSITILRRFVDQELIDSTPVTLEVTALPEFMDQVRENYSRDGYAFAKAQLSQIQFNSDTTITADLQVTLSQKQRITGIEVVGMDKFPINLFRHFIGKTVSPDLLRQVESLINQQSFASSSRPPEVLFTLDSAVLYIYPTAIKANRFDGLIGFNTEDEGTLRVNGHLDLELTNPFGKAIRTAINYEGNGLDQRRLDLALRVPSVGLDRVGVQGEFKLFRRDTTFQTTSVNADLFYPVSQNWQTGIGYQSVTGTQLEDTATNVEDFTSSYVSGNATWSKSTPLSATGFSLLNFNISIAYGSRKAQNSNSPQLRTEVNATSQFAINPKHQFQLIAHGAFLESEDYLLNELYRLGGVDTIRGFVNNTLDGDTYATVQTEYRYQIASGLYLHSIVDIGYLSNTLIDNGSELLGVGLGAAITTRAGILQFQIAAGKSDTQELRFNNSVVHLNLVSRF